MAPEIEATFWGFVSGSALVIGAAIGVRVAVPTRVVAGVMAFGAGVLISALAFELMDEAFAVGGLAAALGGFAAGAIAYGAANRLLARFGARHRKRSGAQQPTDDDEGSGAAIAVGALLDGVPESVAIGLGVLQGGAVSVATVAAIFLSNLPEGLSSATGMRRAGRSARYVYGVWGTIAVACGLSALAGCTLFGALSPVWIAATTALAAGAMLTMIVDTMIPEAFAETHDWAGLLAVAGFAVSFALTKAAG